MTMDQIERTAIVAAGTPLGNWANRVIRTEARRVLDQHEIKDLPQAVLADDDLDCVVVGLQAAGRFFTKDGWQDGEIEGERLEIDEATTAWILASLSDGVDAVILRSWAPVAVLAAPPPPGGATPHGVPDVPPQAIVAAVVDDLDKTAVIDLIAVAPGPQVYRRHDGEWYEDQGWLKQLKSVTPPPLVELTKDMIPDVVSQVDESTAGQPFAETGTKPVTASAWAEEHVRRADELAVELALTAAKNPAKGAKGAEQLRQYWLHGKGAVKIKWGAPGDWKRCVKHLSKYMNERATGYCNLLHARATGAWTGSKEHRKNKGGVYANPKVRAEAVAKELSH